MPVNIYPKSKSIWFEMPKLGGGTDFPILTIWDDGEVILESNEDGGEFIYPTLEEWEFLAQIVNTNIERLREENSGNQHPDQP